MKKTTKAAQMPPSITLRLSRGRSVKITWRPRQRVSSLLVKLLTKALAVFLPLSMGYAQAADVNALPTGGQVTAGSATINQTGNTLNINQASQKAALNWQTFNIGTNGTVNFVQPNSNAVALNRIGGNSASEIYGHLNANGQVFLMNPNGILFGRGSQVNVGGIVATTMQLGDADFLAGNYNFSNAGVGSVANYGLINATNSVALLGSDVSNQGSIFATTASLVSGNTVALDVSTDGLIRARVVDVAMQANIANSGDINATQVTLSAGQAKDTLNRVVNNSGVIKATGFSSMNGEITLQGGTTLNSGTLDATSATGNGGTVHMLGQHVGVVGSGSIDVSGATGGGTILVGGDYQGKNISIENAEVTYVGAQTTLKADATQNGNGGKVIVWADDTTRAYGSISAQGGALGGDGGFVETSGHRYLDVNGARVNTLALHGLTGNWLLDPTTVIIYGDDVIINDGTVSGASYLSASTIVTNLASTDVIVQTDMGNSGNGNITVDGVNLTSITTNNLTLAAFSDGTANTGNINITNSTISVGGNLTLQAGWDSTSNPDSSNNVIPNFGSISITDSSVQSGSASTLNLWAGKDINIAGSTVQGGLASTVNLSAENDIILTNSNDLGTLVQGNSIDVWAGRDLKLININNYTSSIVDANVIPSISLKSTGIQDIIVIRDIILTAGTTSNGITGSSGGSVVIEALGDQTISADSIKLTAGASGHDNSATIRGGSNQDITVSTSLELQGGAGGTHNQASIEAFGVNTDQTIDVFTDITLTGGSGGGTASDENGASIGLHHANLSGQQQISANNININGGAADFGGAGFGTDNGNYQQFIVSGNLTMTGGASNNADFKATPAYIGSEFGADIDLQVDGNITLTGGTGTAGGVLIGSLEDTSNPTNVNITAGHKITTTGGVWIGVKATPQHVDGGSVSIVSGDTPLFTAFISVSPSPPSSSDDRDLDLGSGTTIQAADYIYLGAIQDSTITDSGNIILNSHTNLWSGDSIAIEGGGNVALRGTIDATNELAASAGNNDGNTFTTDGGNLTLSTTGTLTSVNNDFVRLSAYEGSNNLSTGNIIIESDILNIPMLSINGKVSANALEVTANTFILEGGKWSQVSSTLPNFDVNDFRITGGTFIRALAGDGGIQTPYELKDIYGVQGMASAGMLDKSFVLANNIDASGTTLWNEDAGFMPIGDGNTEFTGSFNGNNHNISGLEINRPFEYYVGLFGFTYRASISHVGLVDASIYGGGYTGGLVGYNDASTISQSYVSGNVNNSGDHWHCCDGLVSTGGLVGYNAGEIINTYSDATVNMENTYSTNWCDLCTGGLVGLNNYNGTITSSYSSGRVTSAGSSPIGGLIGYNDNTSMQTESYWDQMTSGLTVSAGGTGLNTTAMMQAATFVNWDIGSIDNTSTIWRISEGSSYPLLRSSLISTTPTITDDVGVDDVIAAITNGSQTSSSTEDNQTKQEDDEIKAPEKVLVASNFVDDPKANNENPVETEKPKGRTLQCSVSK